MGKVRVIVLRFPGTNCDLETAFAFRLAGAEAELVHISQLICSNRRLQDYQIMVIPGGFAYGDDLGAGVVQAKELCLKLAGDIERFVASGCLILGICNGFQALVKAGILPGGAYKNKLTLTNNDSGRFECRWVHLAADPQSRCVFTRGIERLYLPVAHGEGKIIADTDTLNSLDVPLYYTDENGNHGAGYPSNPNGSMNDIAGLCDATGRIFALMPHPERHIRHSQHPSWTRGSADGPGDGLKIFQNAVDWAKNL